MPGGVRGVKVDSWVSRLVESETPREQQHESEQKQSLFQGCRYNGSRSSFFFLLI